MATSSTMSPRAPKRASGATKDTWTMIATNITSAVRATITIADLPRGGPSRARAVAQQHRHVAEGPQVHRRLDVEDLLGAVVGEAHRAHAADRHIGRVDGLVDAARGDEVATA